MNFAILTVWSICKLTSSITMRKNANYDKSWLIIVNPVKNQNPETTVTSNN